MPPLRILISGASIAGPALAHFLTLLPASPSLNTTTTSSSTTTFPPEITVLERHPHPRPGGQAIDIRTAGVTVSRKIPGLEAAVLAHSTHEEGVSFVDSDGRPFGVIHATGDAERQGLVSEFEILRGDLAGLLYQRTKDEQGGEGKGVRYVFGEWIVSMRHGGRGCGVGGSDDDGDREGPITVEFASGLETAEYDLVVACDGATSRTRAMGFGCGVREHIVPTNVWAAYFSTKMDLLEGSRIGQGYSAVGGRSISLGTDPGGFSRVMLISADRSGQQSDAIVPFRKAASQGEEDLKRYIAKHYEGVGWMTDVVMREMMDAEDFYASEIIQVKVPTLFKGRFVLVGDAGYAAGLTGGGTTLTLAGAYILAGEIGKHPGDLTAALRSYEEKMQPLIKETQKIPPLVSSLLAPQTAWGIWFRNYAFALAAWRGIAEFAQRYLVGGAAFASPDKFPLPEYDWIA